MLTFGLIVLLFPGMVLSGNLGGTLDHSTFLDSHHKMMMRWAFNASHIDVELTGQSLGWVAVSISPNGGMDQSDVLLGWVDDNTRQTTVQDRWNIASKQNGVNLMLDTQQDWMLVSGSQNATHTVIRAIRKLETCDSQDRPFTSDTLRIIFAMNPADPRTPTVISQHTFRGGKSMLLLTDAFKVGASTLVDQDPSVQQIDLLADQVHVPIDTRTLYQCILTRLPPVDHKMHIISVKPTITPGNEGFVHHVLAYLCDDKITDDFPDKNFKCTFDDTPNDLRNYVMGNCSTILGVFGIGADTYYFPPEVGLPITPEMSGKYVFLELHYDNPDGKDITDSSGISLVVSSNLRQYDAATIMFANNDLNYYTVIPPQRENFVIYPRCTSNCTLKNFPTGGVNVINVFLHAHMLGRKIYLRQVRNNKELSPIAKDDSYDFNYQESQRLNPPRKIMPGDEVIVECHYNSMQRKKATFGGWGSPDEMCMAFVTYYPATPMTQCGSGTDLGGLLKITQFIPQSTTLPLDQPVDDAKVMSYLKDTCSWTNDSVAALQNFYKTQPFYGLCTRGGGDMEGFMYALTTPKQYAEFNRLNLCHRSENSDTVASASNGETDSSSGNDDMSSNSNTAASTSDASPAMNSDTIVQILQSISNEWDQIVSTVNGFIQAFQNMQKT